MANMTPIPWWRRVTLPWRRWRLVGRVEAADEVPTLLPRRGVVLVGPVQRPTWAAFDCPCGRGHRLMVNLDMSRHPAWRVDRLRPLSIGPSIDNIEQDRRCHFIVRSGRIRWVRDDRRLQ
jgi:hypothetical protein